MQGDGKRRFLECGSLLPLLRCSIGSQMVDWEPEFSTRKRRQAAALQDIKCYLKYWISSFEAVFI